MTLHDPRLAEVGCLNTRVGAAFPGSRAVFRGHDLHQDLHNLDWMDLYLFGITGRRLSESAIRMLHAIWVCTSYPDARLWNNRIAALASNSRSTATLSLSAALAVSEASIYGGQAGMRAMDFLLRAQARVEAGEDLTAVVQGELKERRILGYGRPINAQDERLPWLMRRARELGLAEGPHLRLAYAIEAILVTHRPNLKMNNAAWVGAMCADLGLSRIETQLFRFPMFLAGMAPCLIEAGQRPAGAFLPIPCESVHYDGPAPRAWPS